MHSKHAIATMPHLLVAILVDDLVECVGSNAIVRQERGKPLDGVLLAEFLIPEDFFGSAAKPHCGAAWGWSVHRVRVLLVRVINDFSFLRGPFLDAKTAFAAYSTLNAGAAFATGYSASATRFRLFFDDVGGFEDACLDNMHDSIRGIGVVVGRIRRQRGRPFFRLGGNGFHHMRWWPNSGWEQQQGS